MERADASPAVEPLRTAPRPAEEALFATDDARSSATWLAILTITAVTLFSWAQRDQALPGVVVLVRCAIGALSAALLALRCATRGALSHELARLYSLLIIGGYAALVGLIGLHWERIGRPWEVFASIQLALASVSLIAPLSLRLGLAALLLYFVEAMLLVAGLTASPATRAAIPLGEPGATLLFVLLSGATIVMRHQRRRRVLRYLRVAGAAAALRATAGQLREVSETIRAGTAELRRLVQALSAAPDRVGAALARSIERVDGVGRDLGRMSQPPDRVHHRALTTSDDDERQLYAANAHHGATITAVVFTVGGLVAQLFMASPAMAQVRHAWLWADLAGLAALAFVRATRDRPSRLRAELITVSLVVITMLLVTVGQRTWPTTHQRFEPLIGTKVLFVIVPLVLSSRLGLALELLVLLQGIALYFAHHASWGIAVSTTEPWLTALYALIGVALVRMREHRRITSSRLLRADLELATLVEQTRTSLQALDRLGSPLQVLRLHLEQLGDGGDAATAADMQAALARIIDAMSRLPPPDGQAFVYLGDALDR